MSATCSLVKLASCQDHHWLRALGHSNEIVCFRSPPASILGAIQKNYVFRMHNPGPHESWDKMAVLNAAFYLNRLRVQFANLEDDYNNGCCPSYSLFGALYWPYMLQNGSSKFTIWLATIIIIARPHLNQIHSRPELCNFIGEALPLTHQLHAYYSVPTFRHRETRNFLNVHLLADN